ncbi:unnamed protein product [Peronospora belbahrii]|uniref:SET domain-containing protein n=1 Tax=Peronospora belbahrii TaxID=622444 RepID=A0AAU9KX00_9STRA|nr:unnamed protein product [Peronospora belbahrii]CAH0517539.1 unnamed protein product [Peronospora belbahrii]
MDVDFELQSSRYTTLKSSTLHSVVKSRIDLDRYSSVAAPYGPSDPIASNYFQVVISKAKAPIVCGDAGPIKGKAIYAEKDLPKATRIWTESPLVAMQHERNRKIVPCCQFCYLPLLEDTSHQWREIVTRYNAQQIPFVTTRPNNDQNEETRAEIDMEPVQVDALKKTLELLRITPQSCGMAKAEAKCACGELYCSKLCRMRALHEFHAILCPRKDPCSAMGAFQEHTRHTNDIFLLAAKVIARVLSRYLVWRDIVKAREPIDMFYKKPWWEVVVVEHDEPIRMARAYQSSEEMSRQITTSGSDETNSDSRDSSNYDEGSPKDIKDIDDEPKGAMPEANSSTIAQVHNLQQGLTQAKEKEGDWMADTSGTLGNGSTKAQCLQEVLTMTHQLLIDALECNLVRLEREGQLRGVTVEEIWRHCSSLLSFEFFTAQIGLFEMNNISMEVDHPFRAFIDILDPDVQQEVTAGGTDGQHNRASPQLNSEEQALIASVRRVLEWEEERIQILQKKERLARNRNKVDPGFDPSMPLGYPCIEGTALFPIICTMNHSCDPNCTVLYTKNGDGHVVAIRDIQKGEELCICYIDVDMDVKTREANLREYKFKCFCPRCVLERQRSEQDYCASSETAQRTSPRAGKQIRRSSSGNQKQKKKSKTKCSNQGR